MPPQYVKPYVKTQKNDMADAEAICEAVTRPTMRFVPAKTVEQQVSVRSGRGMGPVKRISHVEARPHKVLSFCW